MTTVPTKTGSNLLDAFPRVECGFYPTPLEELVRLRKALGPGAPRIFIKRDDYTGTGFGSNKLRKLDFAIADELKKGTTTIITIAGEKSNHARVTAAVCAKFGLKCILILNRAEKDMIPAGLVCGSRYVYERLGPEIHWVGTREEREPKALEILDRLQNSGEKAAYVPLGVSVPLGALGFVNAIGEIAKQFEKIGAWPDYIFHAGTSGGTQAGMIAGCQLYGLEKTCVVAVSPDDPSGEIAQRVAEITNGIYRLLGQPGLHILPEEIAVLDEFIGRGYGVETEKGREAANLLAATEAVILDPVYTAKAMSALLDWIEKGKLTARDNVLFWHTGGQLAWFFAKQ
jgi:1-aminocyclopropane-1-carboxylate deaminase/D-cysteine desulfhydrase-like pyridoxal-dependent ACC family enzyme